MNKKNTSKEKRKENRKYPYKKRDRRKRTHCKVCKKRVNLIYTKLKNNKIRFFCPNCGSHGEVNIKKSKNYKK